jgi:hypothetical protein
LIDVLLRIGQAPAVRVHPTYRSKELAMGKRYLLLWSWLFLGAGAMAQEACPHIPPMYVGKWSGVTGTGESFTRTQTGTAVVVTDFGHSIDRFELMVAADGKVTGSGTATYRFNASTAANLIAAKVSAVAELDGKTQKVDFTISGTMTRMGKLKLEAKPAAALTLLNASKRETMPAWNVFSTLEAEVEASGGKLSAETFGVTVVNGKTTKIAWKVTSDAAVSVDKDAKLPAAEKDGRLPKIYVGRWEGSGKQRSKRQVKIGKADVLADLGAVIDEIVLDVADNGKVTGRGKATYWFDVSADAKLILARQAPYAHLDGNIQQIDFDVSGTMTSEGKMKLQAAPKKDLKRINNGKEESQGAWNVFGGIEAAVQPGGPLPIAKASGVVDALKMNIDWKVKKKALAVRGRVVHRVYVPKGDEKGNFIDINSSDWAKIGPRVVPPAGKVRVEAFFVEPNQKDETGDPFDKTDTDDHGCFQLLVPALRGKTLRLRTTYANNEAILKEQCRIDVPMDRILDKMERMKGSSASEPVGDIDNKGTVTGVIKRQTDVWVRYSGELKKIDLGNETRDGALRKYPAEPYALELNALNSILVNSFILKAPYVSQNRNPVNVTGVKVPAKTLWDLLQANGTDKDKIAFRQRLGLGEKDEVPVEKTTDVKIIGGEVCFPSSAAMAMGCLGKVADPAAAIGQIGQGCYDNFDLTKRKDKPAEFPYATPQYDTTRWPYRDHKEPTGESNDKKWLVTCKGTSFRPWQNTGGSSEPYLCGYIKNQYGVDSKVQGDPPKKPYDIFDAANDGTVLQKLGSGGPALASIVHKNASGEEGGHGICLLGAVIDNRGNIKRLIFHDPYGDQTQHPTVEGFYGQPILDKKGNQIGHDPAQEDVDRAAAKGGRAGVKGRYAPYFSGINSSGGSLRSKFVVWWLNPEMATPEKMQSRLLPSEFPLTAQP